jgi:voltage-gated potassium channel
MDRRRWFGSRATVWLVTLVAVLSFVVGVINIVTTQAGLLWQAAPEIARRTAGFTGAMTGFLMLLSAAGLRRGLRAAWYTTLVLLPVTALQGLIQGSPVSAPLVALSVLSLPVVALNRKRFAEEVRLSVSQLASVFALAGALVYGTAGSYALRDEFPQIETLLDAFYFALVTASTVGYGDITATTQVGRLFSLTVLVIGVASFGLAAGTLLGPAIEARFAAALGTMSDAQLNMLEDHIVVLGYGELTEPILEELQAADVPFIVVTDDNEKAAALRNRDITVLSADPSDESPLHQAGVERAAGVVAATNNDAEDALAILTARELAPDVRIVAAATVRENSAKLRRAGADAVISPAVLGGHLLVQSALGREDVEGIADHILGTPGEESAAEAVDEAVSEDDQ